MSSTLNEFNFKLIHLQLSLIKNFDLGYNHRDEAQGLSIVCGVPLQKHPTSFKLKNQNKKSEFRNLSSRGAQCRDEAQGYTTVCGVPLHQHPMSSSWIPKIF